MKQTGSIKGKVRDSGSLFHIHMDSNDRSGALASASSEAGRYKQNSFKKEKDMAVLLPYLACSADSYLCIHMNKYSYTIILLMHLHQAQSDAVRKLDRMKSAGLRYGVHICLSGVCVCQIKEPLIYNLHL